MNKIKTCLLCFATILYTLTATAQTFLKGRVTDEQMHPQAFVPVGLYAVVDSVLLLSALSDSTGDFQFALPKGINTYTAVKLMGYAVCKVNVPLQTFDTSYIKMQLTPSTRLLHSVEISAAKPMIERKADRIIFNTENSIAAIGSNAFELLKQTPGVKENNGVVSIAGKSTVSVMINGRLTQVNGSELETMLRSMPSANISSIEVITAPPAKYDAEGNSGIINIVTRKSLKNGFNGNVTLSDEQRTGNSQNADAAFNYRRDKLNVFGTTNANHYRFMSLQQTDTQYPKQKQEQVLNQDNRPLYTWSQLGADYSLNEKSVLGILYTHGTMDTKRDENIHTGIFSLPGLQSDSFMITDAYATDKGVRNVLNLNYDRDIDASGKKCSVNLDYFNRNGDKTRNFNTQSFGDNGLQNSAGADNHTRGKIKTIIQSARVDFELPASIAKFSFGGKISSIHNNSDNVFTYLSGQYYVIDSGKTNAFDYTENTQALYTSAAATKGKWDMQLGLRAEYTQTNGVSLTLNQSNQKEYLKLFPTAYVQYKPDEANSVTFNYSRRISRPSFWNMNPFRVYSTATSFEEGNPFLQPSFSNNLELGYTYKSVLVVTAFFQQTDAYATRVSKIDTVNNSFYFSQANAGNELNCGISAMLQFRPFPWWESNIQLFGTYSRFSSVYYSTALRFSRPGYSLELNNNFTLNKEKTLMAELGFNYEGRSQADFDIQSAYYNLSAGLKAFFFRKNIMLAVHASDILRSDIWQVRNQYNSTYQNSYFDNRCVRISVSWKFGNQGIKGKRERNVSPEELKRSG